MRSGQIGNSSFGLRSRTPRAWLFEGHLSASSKLVPKNIDFRINGKPFGTVAKWCNLGMSPNLRKIASQKNDQCASCHGGHYLDGNVCKVPLGGVVLFFAPRNLEIQWAFPLRFMIGHSRSKSLVIFCNFLKVTCFVSKLVSVHKSGHMIRNSS